MESSDSTERVDLLGVPYDNLSRAETLDLMEEFIAGGRTRMICTPNADHIMQVRHDLEFRRVLMSADLNVADGMAVVYASRLLGTPLKQNVGGRLLLEEFATRSAREGYRMFLLGGRDVASAEGAANRLCEKNAGLTSVGFYSPPFMPEFNKRETDRMITEVQRANADILFVALGTPKQEKWIATNLKRLNVPVAIGVGAAVDMLAGQIRQPSAWITNVGLEWLFRLAQEPRRLWRRYLIRDMKFVALVIRELSRGRKRRA
jgi:N-acetylglucosaminyldiphosphoundecaprenol N-acetyl-beta-D-mannosaminyltransferase